MCAIVSSTGIGQLFPIIERGRKLKATWTVELSKDLNAFYGNDVLEDLVQMVNKELTHDNR